MLKNIANFPTIHTSVDIYQAHSQGGIDWFDQTNPQQPKLENNA